MKITELQFDYPEDLVAYKPVRPSRVMLVDCVSNGSRVSLLNKPIEVTLQELLQQFKAGDVLVVNDTQVLKRRVFVGDLEVLFLKQFEDQLTWEVLFPSKKYKIGQFIDLPDTDSVKGLKMELLEKGRPQKVKLSVSIDEDYFQKVGELPLPPYIQKARAQSNLGTRHSVVEDDSWYQTSWAYKPGSFAAPTASLHFSENDISELKNKGVGVVMLTLHVGLGTFLPVLTEDLNDHVMHSEYVEISAEAWCQILKAKELKHNVWSLGTTSTRALESAANGCLKSDGNGGFFGETQLLIQPGFDFKIVDRLLTNFHQPESTLLALVAAFSDLKTVKACYRWAIEHKFRLFSYGDLSCWIKK